MKCAVEGCEKEAVTSHGVTTTTHGYCEKHRCCYRCGLHITDCQCEEGYLERPEFLNWVSKNFEILYGFKPPRISDQI